MTATPNPQHRGAPTQPGDHPIDITLADDIPPCARCDGQALLAARTPRPIQRNDGHLIHGTTLIVLCPRCDIHQPAAGALITYFHVHGHIDNDTLHQCADLLLAWIESIHPPQINLDTLNNEYEAWKRGEL